MYKLRREPVLMPRHGKSRQHTDNTSTHSLHPPTLPPIPLPSLESQRIFPVDPRHFILRIPRDTETPTNLRIPPHLSTPKPRALQNAHHHSKMPYLPTSQAYLEQSAQLLQAYPDTVSTAPTSHAQPGIQSSTPRPPTAGNNETPRIPNPTPNTPN